MTSKEMIRNEILMKMKRRKLNALFEWMRKSGMVLKNPVENTAILPIT